MLTNARAMGFLLPVFLLLTQCSVSVSKTIYVDDNAAGANNGSSWANAYTFLQEALADANVAEKSVEIRVAQGIYRPDEGLVAIPEFDWRTFTFQLIDGLTLKGGYAGLGAPDPNVRDVDVYETILSGDLNGDDMEDVDIEDPQFLLDEPTRAENSYHVVTGSSTDGTAVLDGFTITSGNANGSSAYGNGAGLYNLSGSPTLTNCTFRGNSAWNGGGMYNHVSSPNLTHCTFSENSAINGGGMYNHNSSPVLTNCIFAGNSAFDVGGVYNSWNASSSLINCILWDNTVPQIAGNAVISYSDVQGGYEGKGNIDADPLFADPDNGDYHLKSEAGRWDLVSEGWVADEVTSPCIDAGDPNSPVAFEPFPNGGIVNMGAYGGMMEASKSPTGLHAKYGGGRGEPNNPFLIYTPEQMNTIGIHAGDWDKHFKLMEDIDLSAYIGTDFNIIGFRPEIEDQSFTGVFDGNGHTISNFTYISTDVPRVGLFDYVEGQTVKIRDLGLINPNVSHAKGNYVGSLVGYLGTGMVRHCYVQDGSVSGGHSVGGLVAYNHKGALVDCYSSVHVAGVRDVGGLVGFNGGTIIGCHTMSTVTGEDTAGGLAGFNDGTIRESTSTGDVIGEKNVGGLAGYSRFGMIQNSYATGSATGIQSVGGLAGRSRGDIVNCYARGSVTGGLYVGGLVGFLGGPIVDSYSTGHLIHEPIESFGGNPRIGGLVGSGHSPDDILTSFWDVETSGQTISFGGTGKTTAEMQTAGTFLEAGWDFVDETDNGTNDIWWMAEGLDYPRLWWGLTNEN